MMLDTAPCATLDDADLPPLPADVQIEALTVERDGLAQALAVVRADLKLAVYTLLATRARWRNAEREVTERGADRAFLGYALERLLDNPNDAKAQADARAALARWEGRVTEPVTPACQACGAAHDVQRCPEVGRLLHGG